MQMEPETDTDPLNETMWLEESPSPSYQRLSPAGRHDERNIITNQHVSLGYHVSDGTILWHSKHESSRQSPDTNHHLHSNVELSRGNSPSQVSSGYNQLSGVKRRLTEHHQQIGELDRKCTRRDGINGNVGNQVWSARQVEEFAEHLAADFDGSLSSIAANDLVNAVTSYSMNESLLTLPSLTVFKQEAPSPENQVTNINLNNVPQKGQNNGNINLSMQADSNDNRNIDNNPSTTTAGHTVGINSNTNERESLTSTSLQQLLYSSCDDFPTTSGNLVSSSQQGNEFNEDNRFQYVLAAATSIATKINEETLTYLNQGQPYEIKLKKLGDLSAYRGKILKSTIKILFHERRLQYTEREQMLAWEQARPGESLLEIDVPLSYGISVVPPTAAAKNVVEIMWDPTKEVGVYIKVNCISTEFTPKKHGGEKGVPFRIQVETLLPGGCRLHAASCQIKVFKLKGADRKHKQDQDKIRRRASHEQSKYQNKCDCTVLSDIPLDTLPSIPEKPEKSEPEVQPSTSNHSNTPTSPINNLIVNHPTLKMSTTSSPLSDDSNVTRSPEISSLPNETINLSSLPYDADTHQCINWLRQNGCQYPESKLGSITASALRGYSRTDMIEIFGQIDGINLYNNLHPNPKKIYIGIKNNEVYSWKLLYFYNTTAQAFIMKVLITFNLTNIKFDSVWLEGPHKIRVLLENEHIKNMKNESTFIIQIDEDLENHRYNLILIPFHGDRRED